jgi:hypothetical protein
VIGLGRDKSPKIEFIADTKAYSIIFDKPEPAKNFIPEWYKKTKSNFPGNFIERMDHETGNPLRTELLWLRPAPPPPTPPGMSAEIL